MYAKVAIYCSFAFMIQLDDKIISTDIFNKYFLCDLKSCKGACCVEGDAGAPITFDEEIELKKILNDVIRPYMTEEGIKAIGKNGVAIFFRCRKRFNYYISK